MTASNPTQQIDLGIKQKRNRNFGGRRYKHSLNGYGGVNSVCTHCHTLVASSMNEWDLLDEEKGHLCADVQVSIQQESVRIRRLKRSSQKQAPFSS